MSGLGKNLDKLLQEVEKETSKEGFKKIEETLFTSIIKTEIESKGKE